MKKFFIGLFAGMSIMYLCSQPKADYRYAVASEEYPGRHYEYYTDSECEVGKVTDNEVYVIKNDGNIYSYYSDAPDLEVGDKVIVTFNEAMDIINVN